MGRNLSPIDIARLLSMSTEVRRPELAKLCQPAMHGLSYERAQQAAPLILGVDSEDLFGDASKRTVSDYANAHTIRVKNESNWVKNLAVMRALDDFRHRRDVTARRLSTDFGITGIQIGNRPNARFWIDALLFIDGRPIIGVLDPRSSIYRLSDEACEVMFAIIEHFVRTRNFDLSEATSSVLRTKVVDKGKDALGVPYETREIVTFPSAGGVEWSRDELTREIAQLSFEFDELRAEYERRKSA